MLKKEKLLFEKYYQNPFHSIFFVILVISLITFSYYFKTYDLYPIYAEVLNDEQIKITLTYEDLKLIQKDTKVKYQNTYHDITNITYQDIYIENNIPYETIIITTDLKLNGEKLVKVNLANNYKRIIYKIKENLFGGK